MSKQDEIDYEGDPIVKILRTVDRIEAKVEGLTGRVNLLQAIVFGVNSAILIALLYYVVPRLLNNIADK